jgi:hypothetical protein
MGVLILTGGFPLPALPVLPCVVLVIALFWYKAVPWWVSWGLGSAILLAMAVATGLGLALDTDVLTLLALVLFVDAAVRVTVSGRMLTGRSLHVRQWPSEVRTFAQWFRAFEEAARGEGSGD